MMINAGDLDKRISIYPPSTTRDASGYIIPNPDAPPVWSCWAQFTRRSAKEADQAGADFSVERVRFLIRTPPKSVSIDRKMTVEHAGKRYEIIYANDYTDAGAYMEIEAERKTTEAQ